MTLADVWQLRDSTIDVVHDTAEKISRLGLANSAAVKHRAGTVILSRTASVGFSAILGSDMATSQDFATWTCGQELNPRYLLQALRAMAPDLRRLVAGSTHKTIYMPDIEQLRIPLPPIADQCAIAEFLDGEVAYIDRIRRARDAQRAAVSERLAATISEVLFPGILTEHQRDPAWAWLPEMGPNRPLVRLGYLCRLQSGLTIDGSRDINGDVVTRPYLRVANVQAGRLDLNHVAEVSIPRSIAARSRLQPGDVLMTEGGDLDKLGRGTVWRGEIEDCLHQNHVFAIRPEPGKLDGDYLALVTQSLHGRCYFESTGVKTTNLASTNSNKILSFPMPLPELDVQRCLVHRLNAHIEIADRTLAAIDHQTALLGERKQALITAAVTGHMSVTAVRGCST
jgi:type I restriction enzyme, S subunit